MWLVPLFCVLGVCSDQVYGKDNSTQMFYFTLVIEEEAIPIVSENILYRDYYGPDFTLHDINNTTECDVADSGEKTCRCTEGFVWSEEACSSKSKCCGAEPCNNTSFTCRSIFTVTLTGSLTLQTDDLFYYRCLDDPLTADFHQCNDNLTQKIQAVFSHIYGFDRMSVVKYRKGSVIVDFSVVVVSDLELSVLQRLSEDLKNNLGATLTLQTTGVARLSMPKGPLDFSSNTNLSCAMNSAVGKPTWQLRNYKNENNYIYNGTESTITYRTEESTIQLSSLSQHWHGTYSCIFVQSQIKHTATADLDVCAVPEITMSTEPAFPRCDRSTDLIAIDVSCEIEQIYEAFTVSWEKEDISENIQPQKDSSAPGVRIFRAQAFVSCSSTTPKVTCRLTNRCNQEQVSTKEVILIRVGVSFCPKDKDWLDTPVNHDAVLRCSGSVGNRVRRCNGDKTWGREVSKCVNLELHSVLKNANISDLGQGQLETNAQKVFKGLLSVTENTNMISREANLETSVTVIETMNSKLHHIDSQTLNLKEHHFHGNKQEEAPPGKVRVRFVEDFLTSSSNLLDKTLESTWASSDGNQENETLAEKYLSSVEMLINKANLEQKMKKENLEVASCNGTESSLCSNKVFNNTVTINGQGATVKTAGFKYLDEYLPKQQDNYTVNTLVVSTTMQSLNRADKVKIRIGFSLKKPRPRNTEMKCVFWDFNNSVWSEDGCDLIGEGVCECNHLSAFSILMSKFPLKLAYLSEVTYVGLSLSIVSLIICLVVELIIWHDVVKTDTLHLRHCAHVNISVCLLGGDVCFLASALINEPSDIWCKTFVVVEHFCFLAMFFWMFCLSSILLHKTVYVSLHGVGKTAYLRFSIIVGYICPLLIVVITFLANSGAEGQYYSKETRWLVYSGVLKGSIFTFILPVGIIVFMNVFFMCLVIMKLLQPIKALQTEDKEKNSAKTVIRSVIFLTPVFGLTWGLGFLMILFDLTYGTTAYVISFLFTIMNAFQGLYIFLTTCVFDKMVREGLQRYFRKKIQGVSSFSSGASESQSSVKK